MKIRSFIHKQLYILILSIIFSIPSFLSVQAFDINAPQALEFLTALLRGSASKIECQLLSQQDKSKESLKQRALISGLRSIHDVIAAYNHPSHHSFGYLEGFALYDAGQTLKHFRDAFTLIEGPLDAHISTDIQSKDSSEQRPQLTKTLLRTTILPEIERLSGILLSFYGQTNANETHVLLLKALLTFSRLCQISIDQDPGITKNVAFITLFTHLAYTFYNLTQQMSPEALSTTAPVPAPEPREGLLSDERQGRPPQDRHEQQHQHQFQQEQRPWRPNREEQVPFRHTEPERLEQQREEQLQRLQQERARLLQEQADRERAHENRQRELEEQQRQHQQQFEQEQARIEREAEEQRQRLQQEFEEDQRNVHRQYWEQEQARLQREQAQQQQALGERIAINRPLIDHFPHAREHLERGININLLIEQNPEALLGLGRNATLQEVTQAFRRLSARYHPDRNMNASTEHQELNNQIQGIINRAAESARARRS